MPSLFLTQEMFIKRIMITLSKHNEKKTICFIKRKDGVGGPDTFIFLTLNKF